MRVETTDPINGTDVENIDQAPYVIEGYGKDSLKIFFSSEENKQIYQNVEEMTLGSHAVDIYNQTTGVSIEM